MTVFAGLAAAYPGAAAFLTCRDFAAPADAVVLFIGPDYAELRKEAQAAANCWYSQHQTGCYFGGYFWRTTQQQEIDYIEEQGQKLSAFF